MSGILKEIRTSHYSFPEQVTSLVDICGDGHIDRTWFEKRAAHALFKDAQVHAAPGRAILHVIAMGDYERYGGNSNGDAFFGFPARVEVPEPKNAASRYVEIRSGNDTQHRTFESHGAVYRDHKNRDKAKAHGRIVKAARNPEMWRTELLIDVPADEEPWRSDVEKAANNERVDFSMSANVRGDSCSICGNFAPTRKFYCTHLRNDMNRITKSGHIVQMLNHDPVYFDMSRVGVGADRIAVALRKAASAGADTLEAGTPWGSLDMERTSSGLIVPSRKRAVLSKLADIEKEIELTIEPGSPLRRAGLALVPEASPPLDEDAVVKLGSGRDALFDILGEMADARISLSLRDFMRLVCGNKFSAIESKIPDAQACMPGIFGRMLCGDEPSVLDDGEEVRLSHATLPATVKSTIVRMIPSHSLEDEPVRGRMMLMVLRGRVPGAVVKSASAVDETALRMARTYALYKLAFALELPDIDTPLTKLAVMQHYVV